MHSLQYSLIYIETLATFFLLLKPADAAYMKECNSSHCCSVPKYTLAVFIRFYHLLKLMSPTPLNFRKSQIAPPPRPPLPDRIFSKNPRRTHIALYYLCIDTFCSVQCNTTWGHCTTILQTRLKGRLLKHYQWVCAYSSCPILHCTYYTLIIT